MTFSMRSYEAVIGAARAAGFRFGDFGTGASEEVGRLYLRHDVDYSLRMAVELASTNARLGARGTFMLLLRSQIYNLLSRESLRLVNEIADLGQSLGLHVPAPDPRSLASGALGARIAREYAFISNEIPQISPVLAWHNPTPEVLALTRGMPRVAGLVNTYHAEWVERIGYLSDSNLRNTPDELIRHLTVRQGRSLQLLIHPLNWVAGGSSMQEIFSTAWRRIIREREEEVGINRWYAAALPQGMPEAVLDDFCSSWNRAVEAASGAGGAGDRR